jgi:tetratricopeptide (TPR) repeat protein
MDVRRQIAVTCDWQAKASVQRGKFDDALNWAVRSAELGSELTRAFPSVTRYRVERAAHLDTLASIYEKMNEPQKAIAAAREATASCREAVNKGSSPKGLSDSLNRLGQLLMREGGYAEAESVYRELETVQGELKISPLQRFEAQARLAMTLIGQSHAIPECDPEAENQHLKQAATMLDREWAQFIEHRHELSGLEERHMGGVLQQLVKFYESCEVPDAAQKWRSVSQVSHATPRCNETTALGVR